MGSKQGNSSSSRVMKGRRIWTPKEEEMLIVAMNDLVTQGWKADKGFRADFLHRLEAIYIRLLPGTDIRATPHMNSKITAWRKDYHALCDVLSKSGGGFNLEGTFTVDCDISQWDELIKTDTNAQRVQGKSWPFYNDWKELLEKDRANGEGVEDILEAVNNLEHEYAFIDENYTPGDYHVNLDDISAKDNGENNVCQDEQSDRVPKNKGKKRKSSDGMKTICEVLREISRNSTARLETLANKIFYESELSKARTEVFEKLGNMQGLSLTEKFKICNILGKEVEKLQIFMGLPEAAQAHYVHDLLNSVYVISVLKELLSIFFAA